jgi:ribose/xylose/arabinose/galactoside ABC-type transport system permease subunit
MKTSSSAISSVATRAPSNAARWRLIDRISVVLYFFALLVLFAVFAPKAFTPGTIVTVIQLSIPLLVIATGMTFCLVCGEVDLSVAGIAGLASTIAALQMDKGMPWPFAVALALAISAGLGMLNGSFTAWLVRSFPRFPSFLVTLAMLSLTIGAAQVIQPLQQAVAIRNAGFQSAFGFGSSVVGSYPTWYAIAVLAVAHLILSRSRFGYTIYAIGSNLRAAEFVGFRVVRTKFLVLTLSGLLAGVGGILLAGFVQAGYFAVAKGSEVDAIAAAVIGGTALFGGRGTVLGTVWGY